VQNVPSGGSMPVAIWLKARGDHLAQSLWRSEPQVDQYSRRCTPGAWISAETHRVNILLSARREPELLALLEAFLHLRLRPRYEG